VTPPPPEPRELARAATFFVLTFGSASVAYRYGFGESGWPGAFSFACGLMSLLLAHEMGHYLVARHHGFDVSLPIFIPFPSIFGTAGAVIRLRTPPTSRQALLEMAAAGPVAGALVSAVLLAVSLSQVRTGVDIPVGTEIGIFNDPLLVKALGTLINGVPPGRYDTYPPLAWAGWVGCFLTGMNLIPIGQLDGGHVLSALVGRHARAASLGIAVLVAAGGLVWTGWLVWVLLLLVLGAHRPLPLPPGELPPRARLVALAILALFALTFIPIPMETEVFGG
jgi:membrane-associated protease RseP (regulator of RpoE activity)